MTDFSELGIDIERIRRNPAAIELAKNIQQSGIDISKLNDQEVNAIIECFLIAGRC